MTNALLSLFSTAVVAGGVCKLVDEPAWRDEFERVSAWKAIAADGVGLNIVADSGGVAGGCLRVEYDFSRGSGYAIVRREIEPPLELPPNHRVSFQLRGQGPSNTLEVKLIERTLAGGGTTAGENVWWVNQRDYGFDGPWREVRLPRRRFAFAWGPEPRDSPGRIDAIEIVVTSFNGGRGTVWMDELKIEALPEVRAYEGTPRVAASSRADGDGPLAIAPDGFIGWRSKPLDDDRQPEATIDFGEPRELGGLALEWEPLDHATKYEISGALGDEWFTLGEVSGGNGGMDEVVTPESVVRRIRIHCKESANSEGVRLRSLRVLTPEYADDVNNRLRLVAGAAPRGWWPRYLLNEAEYWTVVGGAGEVGGEGDDREALVSEDGTIELAKQGPSLEPFIFSGGRLVTWNESRLMQSLEDGYLPIPTVTREAVGLRLEVTSFIDDAPPVKPGEGVLLARYRLTNTGAAEHDGSLFLACRPMQVNPTYQMLNTPGGASHVRTIRCDQAGVHVGETLVQALTTPTAMGACAFEEGEAVEHIALGRVPTRQSVDDPSGLASAAMQYPFSLKPGESRAIVVTSPLNGQAVAPSIASLTPEQASVYFGQRLELAKTAWQAQIDRVAISLPPEGQKLWDAVRSNLAYILINRDGAAIQPGSRSYERSWIRDGCLTSSALLAFGLADEAIAFVDWFAPNQYESGKIPCVVDRRGPDPVPEHDSDGEFIYAVMNIYRHTGNAEFLRRQWPRVQLAARHIESLRAQRLGGEFAAPDAPDDKRVLLGLVPESISHEGYSAKPMHSYWDDFWALKGVSDAAEIAGVLGEDAQASSLAALRDSFEQSIGESITLAMRMKSIPYIPGCAELGDFDATSTTIGVWPCDLQGSAALPDDPLAATFERYWQYFIDRRSASGQATDWVNYTPYEWRTVGTMIRLGSSVASHWRERSHEAIAFFLADSRPRGFNHWAEVVWRDPRRAGFIGDMPHTWCGSDFINSFRAMLAYDDDRARRLVIGAGLPLDWVMSEQGVSVAGLHTHAGELTYSVKASATPHITVWQIDGKLTAPAGGIWISPPMVETIKTVKVDGVQAARHDRLIAVPRIPCRVEIEYTR